MIKLERMYHSAIDAFYDRRYISRGRKNITKFDLNFYNILEKQSGPSVHNPIEILRSWYKAYLHNLNRYNMIEQLQEPFQKKSVMKIIIAKIINRI